MIDDLEYVLLFGKYKGWSIGRVLGENASYILWAHQNVPAFRVTERVLKLATRLRDSQKLQFLADMAWGNNLDDPDCCELYYGSLEDSYYDWD